VPPQYTMPPDTRAVGTSDPPGDVNAHTRALNAMGAGLNVLNAAFSGGADPTGVADSSAVLNARVTGLAGAPGAVYVPPGTYKLSSTVGPFVTGQWLACAPGVTFNWTGTGDCFRFVDTSTYNARTTASGGITGYPVIDGSGDGAGSCGIHAGDILQLRFDAAVQNFSKAGDIGVHLDNQNFWTEQLKAYLWLSNNAQQLVFDVSGATTSTNSFARAFLDVVLLSKQNQDGIVLQNGALLYNGRLAATGNFQGTPGANTSAVLRVTGTVPAGHPNAGNGSKIGTSELGVMVECTSATGSNAPQTIAFGTLGTNTILGCTGILDFSMGSLAFAASNWTATGGTGSFVFSGIITGDFNLNNASVGTGGSRSVSAQGALSYGKSLLNAANGNTSVNAGDFFSTTLTGNTTISLNPGGAATLSAAQRKTIILKQAAAGGPFTVAWPSSGSPTTSSPTVTWVGGAAPSMPAAAGAVLIVHLATYDGATWYGEALYPWGPAAPASFAPSNPASTTSVTQVMMGVGATCAYTPAGSGNVQVTVTGAVRTQTAQQPVTAGGRYGTGTAPSNGAAVTGTRFGPAADPALSGSGAGAWTSLAITALLALTPGTAYWFDLAIATGNAADAASAANISMVITELP
jgi:hypothetical protein